LTFQKIHVICDLRREINSFIVRLLATVIVFNVISRILLTKQPQLYQEIAMPPWRAARNNGSTKQRETNMKHIIRNTTRTSLCMFLLAGLLAGLLAISAPMLITQAQSQTSTMEYEQEWFDLETGAIIPDPDPDPIPASADFQFAYNSGFSPHAVIFQNQPTGVQIAYSAETYANVEFSDISSLTFTTSLIDQPFNQVAVLLTPEGNYFKLGFVSESDPDVTFQWEQLYPDFIYLPVIMKND
jgi:hypothetical protein